MPPCCVPSTTSKNNRNSLRANINKDASNYVNLQLGSSFVNLNIRPSTTPVNPLSFEDPIIGRGQMIGDLPVSMFDPERNMCRSLSNVLVSYGSSPQNYLSCQPVQAYWFKNVIRQAIYGSVFRAELLRPCNNRSDCAWERSGEEFAIKAIEISKFDKVYSSKSMTNAEDPLKEIAAMQHIMSTNNCDNVLTMKEAIVDETHLHIVMPYCKGGELFDHASQADRSFNEPQVKSFMKQIVTGLKNLHDAGICHRDISLENVLLDEDGGCRIIDFGLCLRVPQHHGYIDSSPLVKAQGVCGKLFYMAPEVFENKDFNPYAIDVWSCGMMMFMLLTSSPPCEQPSMNDEGFTCIATGNLWRVLEAWGFSVSPDALDILNGMLCVDPRNRMELDEIVNHPWFSDCKA